jgi:2-amino-4-hydroxy-6-hydroxymethyldihydropteridine diphosphokinase
MTQCLIAIGSNLGDRILHLRHAVARLRDLDSVAVTALSPIYETTPVGGPEKQGPYLNAAIAVETQLSAGALLRELHAIETERSRERSIRWGARTLDLDLLTFGAEIVDRPELTIPHPRMHERRFVMVPVCDIAPELVHPRLGLSMSKLLASLPAEEGDLTLFDAGWDDEDRPTAASESQ